MEVWNRTVVAPHRLLNGLKAYWKCNEGSGTTLYDSHNDYDLTMGGSGYDLSVTGKIGTYAYGTNTNAYAYYADEMALQVPFQQMTYTAWIYLTELPSVSGYSAYTFALGSGTAAQFNYVSNTTNRCTNRTYTYNAGNYAVVQNDAFVIDTWYHICWVIPGDGANMQFYLNGYQNESSAQAPPAANPLATPLTNFELGNISSSHASGPKGRMCEVGFWHRALTSSEVLELWNSGTGVTYPFS